MKNADDTKIIIPNLISSDQIATELQPYYVTNWSRSAFH